MNAQNTFLTFDCYGTLVDWRGGIVRAFHGALPEPVVEERILALHAEIEPLVQAGEYRTYREVLRETARRIFERLGLGPPAEPDFLPDSLPHWPPFPDTRDALERLRRRGVRLGILSNVDDDLLARTVDGLGVPFDLLITAEQVRSYKPAPAHFDTARARIGSSSWTHVAQSLFHDIAPAVELGIPVVWINRQRETAPPALRHVARCGDLASLPDRLAGSD